MEKQLNKVRDSKTFIVIMLIGLLVFGCIPEGSLRRDRPSGTTPPTPSPGGRSAAATPVIVLFEAHPPSVTVGDTCTFRWRTRNAASVHLSGVGPVAVDGEKQVTIGSQGVYELTATNRAGKSVTAKRSVKRVTIQGNIPAPPRRPQTNRLEVNPPPRVNMAEANRPAVRPAMSPKPAIAAAAFRPLPAPSVLSPKNGAKLNKFPRQTTLKWKRVKGAAKYGVEIDCYHCCKAKKWCTDVKKTYKRAGSLSGTTYTFNFAGAQPGRWRVWALDRKGRPGKKSAWQNFRYTR